MAKRQQIQHDAHRHGERYTQEEFEKALHMRERMGMSWSQIAARLGRKTMALTERVHQYRNGAVVFHRDRYDAITEEIVSEMIQGSSMSKAARKRGLWPNAVLITLRRRGWDMETIKEMRKGEIRI